MERGFEIPICITDTSAVPELGKFIRLGMDAVVNAVWFTLGPQTRGASMLYQP